MDTAIRLRHLVPLLSAFLLGVLRMEAQAQTSSTILGSMIQAAKTMKTDTIAKTVIEPCLYRVTHLSATEVSSFAVPLRPRELIVTVSFRI